MLLATTLGCTSPLKSDDPATRTRAVVELSDDKELFLIAMNVGVYIGQKSGSYCNAFLTEEHYLDDVRVAAVNRLNGLDWILKCATWQDGCVYIDSGMEQGCLEYKGENYYTHDSHIRLKQKVHPGNAVHETAKKRLAQPSEFARLTSFFNQFHEEESSYGRNAPSIRTSLFPGGNRSSVGSEEDAFIDYYGSIKKKNPLNSVLCEIVAAQNDQQSIREFLVSTRGVGAEIFLDAIAAAIGKLDDSDQASLASLFKRMFVSEKQEYSMPKDFALRVYDHIADPDAEIVAAALKYSDARDFMKILSKVKCQEAFETVFCDKELPQRVKKSNRTELYCPCDVIKSDVKLDAMRDLMAPVKDEAVLSRIALASPMFNARYVAVERMTSDRWLASVAFDRLNDCPYDASVSGYDLVSNRIDWMSNNERQSAMKIRKLAISRIKDIGILRKLRKDDKDADIKKSASERLVALGHSDAEEIIAALKYNRDLFSMLDEVSGEDDLKKIAANAKLRGVRLITANRLNDGSAKEVVYKEVRQVKPNCPDVCINIGGFYLGLNVEDAYALMLSRYGDIKPSLYLDGDTLCIADGNGRDLAWANADSREIHWLTLTPRIVRKIVDFKAGTFDDLKRAVESKLGISFRSGMVSKGEVRQRVADYETVEGEMLRYFVGRPEGGEDFQRTVRKAINQHTIDYTPLQGGLGAVFANAFEDAMQGDENAKNARSPRFAPQGSLQLQFTRNAVKGNQGSCSGGSFDPTEGVINQLQNLSF
ncbi:MAG: hypothetical protein IJG84_08185 [Kiritimatiellae bacterium]|nr:hypothetical protein [Kiritimatiellia bacterium]